MMTIAIGRVRIRLKGDCNDHGDEMRRRWWSWWWDAISKGAIKIILAPCLLVYTRSYLGDNDLYSRYDVDNQWLVHGGNPRWKIIAQRTESKEFLRCLDCNPGTKELLVAKCDRQSLTQRWFVFVVSVFNFFIPFRWKIENVDLQQLKKWEDPTRDLLLWY